MMLLYDARNFSVIYQTDAGEREMPISDGEPHEGGCWLKKTLCIYFKWV